MTAKIKEVAISLASWGGGALGTLILEKGLGIKTPTTRVIEAAEGLVTTAGEVPKVAREAIAEAEVMRQTADARARDFTEVGQSGISAVTGIALTSLGCVVGIKGDNPPWRTAGWVFAGTGFAILLREAAWRRSHPARPSLDRIANKTPPEQFKMGCTLEKEGDLFTAAACFESAAKQQWEGKIEAQLRLSLVQAKLSAENQVELGEFHEKKNDLDTAKKWFILAAQRDWPGQPVIRLKLAMMHEEHGDLDNAIKWLLPAAEKEGPGQRILQQKLGAIFEKKADLINAIKWFSLAAQIESPDQVELQLKLAEICEKQGDQRQTIKWLLLAAQKEGDHQLPTQYKLAAIFEQKGDLEQAIRWLSLLAEKEGPDQIDLQSHLGLLCAKQNKHDDAAKWFTLAAEKESPNQSTALLNVGVYYQNLKKFDLATQWYFRALEKKHPRAQSLLEEICTAQKDFDLAAKLAARYEENGDLTNAIKWFAMAVKKPGPDQARILLKLSALYQKRGFADDLGKALAYLHQLAALMAAEKNWTGEAEAQFKLGSLYLDPFPSRGARDLEYAIRSLTIAAERIWLGQAEAQFKLGVLYKERQAQGDREQAVKWLTLAAAKVWSGQAEAEMQLAQVKAPAGTVIPSTGLTLGDKAAKTK